MKFLILASVILLASGGVEAKTLNCFSRYYGANKFTITVSGEIVSNNVISNVQIKDEGDSFAANLQSLTSSTANHRASGRYADYQDFNVPNSNVVQYALRSITILLPRELTALSGRFDGFASDPNEDNSGSDGYQKLLCTIR